MNASPPGNYVTVSRNSPAYFPPRFGWVEKSQTLSEEFGKNYRPLIRESLTPKFRRLLPANGHASKKVGTVSAQFEVLPSSGILSTAPIEFSRSKIQTLSRNLRRGRLRNSEAATMLGIAWMLSLNTGPFCQMKKSSRTRSKRPGDSWRRDKNQDDVRQAIRILSETNATIHRRNSGTVRAVLARGGLLPRRYRLAETRPRLCPARAE